MTYFLVFRILQRIKKQNRYKDKRRLKNNEGMTHIIQTTKKKQYRASHKRLNSNIKYPDFTWTDVGSEEYLNAIDDCENTHFNISLFKFKLLLKETLQSSMLTIKVIAPLPNDCWPDLASFPLNSP